METACYFENGGTILPRYQKIDHLTVPILFGALERTHDTAHLVSQLQERKETAPDVTAHLDLLGKIAKESLTAFTDPKSLGALATKAQTHLAALQLSTPEMDALLKEALNLGALGGKLSGAGGGGAYFVICPSLSSAKTIQAKLAAWLDQQNICQKVRPTICK